MNALDVASMEIVEVATTAYKEVLSESAVTECPAPSSVTPFARTIKHESYL